MTEAPAKDKRDQVAIVQIPAELLRYVCSCRLTGTEYALWLTLYQIAPSSDRFTDIPDPKDLAAEIGVDPRTIQRAANRLADLGLFTFEIKRWQAKNSKPFSDFVLPHEHFAQNPISNAGSSDRTFSSDFSTDKGIHLSANGSLCPDNNEPVRSPEPLQNKAIGEFSTDARVPEQISVSLKKKTDLVPISTIVLSAKGEIGTSFEAIVRSVQNAGFQVNAAIRATLASLYKSLEPAALQERITNAISAVQEQIRRGNLKKPTPEPLLNAALKRQFTSNEEKREARRKRQAGDQAQARAGSQVGGQIGGQISFPLPEDITQATLAIDQALLRGDRQFALEKLQHLWNTHGRLKIIELIELRKDWPFDWTYHGPFEVSR